MTISSSTHLAACVNRILVEGRVPDEGFADCISTPVFKSGKPGQPKPDPVEPNNFRDITVGQLLAKLVSLVLTLHLSHWAVRHSMISPEHSFLITVPSPTSSPSRSYLAAELEQASLRADSSSIWRKCTTASTWAAFGAYSETCTSLPGS